ncbi:DUF2726 domain-containing protein [Gallaecimonas mangrovi]|uniref:DUF2726 domain-containing protein n=1 Tax=Gallaecimonas mangrovi TaxID=2291597 RepID=UPI000E208B4B|nr:DUF2726 domain-containing protein [Gallaecimonas mangrovi]
MLKLNDELPFLDYFIIGGAVFLLLAFILFLWRRHWFKHAYQRQSLLNERELQLLELLDQACGSDYRVFAKVRWADVIGVQPRFKGGDFKKAFEKICAKRLDFVLCRPDDIAVMAVLELVPEGKPNRARRKRDKFLASICQDILLPLVLVKLDSNTQAIDIRGQIEKAMQGRRPEPAAPRKDKKPATVAPAETPHATEASIPSLVASKEDADIIVPHLSSHESQEQPCPTCGAVMHQRTVSKGQHAGKTFWVCEHYPECKTVLPIKEDNPARAAVTNEGLFTLRATR